MERAIFISSINRETIGDSSSHNFKIKFTPTLRLPSGMKHSLEFTGIQSIECRKDCY